VLSIHEELASGTFLHDKAEAFIIKSLTDNLMLSFNRISLNSLRNLQENKINIKYWLVWLGLVRAINAIFNNILAISWQSVLLVEETGEN